MCSKAFQHHTLALVDVEIFRKKKKKKKSRVCLKAVCSIRIDRNAGGQQSQRFPLHPNVTIWRKSGFLFTFSVISHFEQTKTFHFAASTQTAAPRMAAAKTARSIKLTLTLSQPRRLTGTRCGN